MGNSSAMVIFMSAFSLVAIIMTLSIQAVDPCNNTLLSNVIFNSNSTVSSQLSFNSTCPFNSITFSNDMYTKANLQRGTTGTVGGIGATILSIFPDWLFTGFNWIIHAGVFITNIVGAPYTICLSLFPTYFHSFASAIGAFGSILFLWFLVNWFTGKDN